MKKLGILVTLIFVLLGLSIAQAWAQGELQPMYNGTNAATATLSISGGTANCLGKVKPSGATQSASISMKLQQKKDGRWTTIATWTGSASNGSTASLSKTKSVAKGYEYRVYVSGTIKNSDGSAAEKPSKYSSTVSY
ncbi:MAG: hypothetical protein Q4G52_04040 [Clostridia bacterium]|nr:hypothetical protein [Clostridia bacterium]